MALRQTILTGLLSHSPPPFQSEREITIDLEDTILASTGLDSVLIDMTLSQLLDSQPRRRLLGS